MLKCYYSRWEGTQHTCVNVLRKYFWFTFRHVWRTEREGEWEGEWEGAHNVQSVSTLCVNVFHAALGYLLILHARLSISSIATPQRSIYRPPQLLQDFFSQTTCLGRYTWGLLVRRSFYLSSIWHRIASFRFRFRFIANWIANCPRLCWPLLIYYHAICYLFSRSTEALAISQQNEAAKGASSKGCLLSWFTTIWIMIQLNFNQKSMNCQYNAHTHTWKHTHIYTGMHTCPVCRICGTV